MRAAEVAGKITFRRARRALVVTGLVDIAAELVVEHVEHRHRGSNRVIVHRLFGELECVLMFDSAAAPSRRRLNLGEMVVTEVIDHDPASAQGPTWLRRRVDGRNTVVVGDDLR